VFPNLADDPAGFMLLVRGQEILFIQHGQTGLLRHTVLPSSRWTQVISLDGRRLLTRGRITGRLSFSNA